MLRCAPNRFVVAMVIVDPRGNDDRSAQVGNGFGDRFLLLGDVSITYSEPVNRSLIDSENGQRLELFPASHGTESLGLDLRIRRDGVAAG